MSNISKNIPGLIIKISSISFTISNFSTDSPVSAMLIQHGAKRHPNRFQNPNKISYFPQPKTLTYVNKLVIYMTENRSSGDVLSEHCSHKM